MTKYPSTKAAQSAFDKCKVGDVVWFPGGYTIAGNWQSYGKRAKVVGFTEGRFGCIQVVPDEAPNEIYNLREVVTKANILEMVAAVTTEEEKSQVRGRFQAKEGELAADPPAAPGKGKAVLTSMTKAQLITRVMQLEARLARLDRLLWR